MSEKSRILYGLEFGNGIEQEEIEPIREIFDSLEETRGRIRSRLDMGSGRE